MTTLDATPSNMALTSRCCGSELRIICLGALLFASQQHSASVHAFQCDSNRAIYKLLSIPTQTRTHAKRRPNYDDDEDEWDLFDEDYEPSYRPRKRRYDNLNSPPLTGSTDDTSLNIPSPFGRSDTGLRLPASVSSALLAGVFVLGIGTGVTVDSQINTNPKDLASRDAVDKNAPNPTLCTTYGASAMAFDQRVFGESYGPKRHLYDITN